MNGYPIFIVFFRLYTMLRALCISGWFVESFFYVFEYKNTLKKSIVSIGAPFVGGMFVIILVSGFVPEKMGTEIRKSLVTKVRSIPSPIFTRPLMGNSWNVHGQFTHDNTRPVLDIQVTFSPQNMFRFHGDTIGIYSATGFIPLVYGEMDETLSELFSLATASCILSLGEPLNLEGIPLRWNSVKRSCDVTPQAIACRNQFLSSWMKLTSSSKSLVQRASQYKDIVEKYSKRYNLPTELVYAIICVESGFNPAQVSNRSAHGLMQVVPKMAGVEVNQWFGFSGLPSAEELLHPETNIKYGTSYLYLLMTRYLKAVTNCVSREYCAIAAYNIGVGAMLRTFASTPEEAFTIINTYSPVQVRDHLMQQLPAKETKAFLRKVLNFKESFTVLS